MKIRKTDENRVKIHFNKRNLFICVMFSVFSIAFIWITSVIPEVMRYPRQITGFLAIVFFSLSVIFFFKLFTSEIRRELYRRTTSIFSYVSLKLRTSLEKALKIFGITDISAHIRKDERDIIFENSTRRKKRHGKSYSPKKYTDLENNRERIRYIWSVYILQRKTKDNIPRIYDTPSEMMKRFSQMNEDENFLYDSYLSARYTPEKTEIGSDTVNKHYKFVSGGKKI